MEEAMSTAVQLGLGKKEREARPGSLTFKTSLEDWDMIILLKHHWEDELGHSVTITDVMKASLRYTAQSLLDKTPPRPVEPTQPPPPPPPAPVPEPKPEPEPVPKPKPKPKAKPKLRTRY
jgi:outer membrane biosynthesis protein TonB